MIELGFDKKEKARKVLHILPNAHVIRHHHNELAWRSLKQYYKLTQDLSGQTKSLVSGWNWKIKRSHFFCLEEMQLIISCFCLDDAKIQIGFANCSCLDKINPVMYKMLECECSFAKRPLPQCSIWTRWSTAQLCKLQRSSCSRAGSLRQTAAQSGHFNCSHLQVKCCEMFTICRFLAFTKLPPPGPNCTARPKYLRLA